MGKTGLLLCAAMCAAALFAAVSPGAPAAVAAASGGGFSGPVSDWDFLEAPLNPRSVQLCWGGESTSPYASWNVRIARGTTPPAAGARPAATVAGNPHEACYTASGLVTDEPYTVRITGNSPTGESAPAFHTLAARTPGTFLLAGGSRDKLPWDTDFLQLAVTTKDRRWHAIFPFAQQRDENGTLLQWTFYSTRKKSGWTKPKLVAGSLDSVLAANASSVALTWSDELRRYRPRYRLKTAHMSAFGAKRKVPGARRRDGVFASALDRRGRLHLLTYGRRADGGAVYASNGSGKWHQQVIPAAWGCNRVPVFFAPCPEPPLLTYDTVSDRIVVVSQGLHDVRLASKRASARRFGALRPLGAANRRHLSATSLASRGSHTTLGLASKPASDLSGQARGPFYVWADGQLVRLRGTTANDQGLLVAASSSGRVKLAWQRLSPTWDRSQQGIWTAESVRDPRTGRWSIRNVSHRTDSHYDVLDSLTVTATGRALVAYKRLGRG
jgi:hypothetical protein